MGKFIRGPVRRVRGEIRRSGSGHGTGGTGSVGTTGALLTRAGSSVGRLGSVLKTAGVGCTSVTSGLTVRFFTYNHSCFVRFGSASASPDSCSVGLFGGTGDCTIKGVTGRRVSRGVGSLRR